MKFISSNPYQFFRYDSIGINTKDIQKYNKGIQFINGEYETDDITTIHALRNYIQSFINKGVEPIIWEDGQIIEIVKEEETKVNELSDYSKRLQDIESFINR